MADLQVSRNPCSPSLCDECCSNPWKYRCPGCSIKSCSLPCVKSHKNRTNCTGKRNRTEFVPLSQFDDNLLISDYKLLEETKRVAESAHKMAGVIGGFRRYIGFKLPKHLLMLRNAATRRRTMLLLLPPGMSKKQNNRSRYDCRKNSISWTIEWKFNGTDVVRLDHGVDEHTSLFSVIQKHLAPTPWKDQLTPYRNVQVENLKFFLRKSPKGLKSPFRELDIKAPIGRQLANVMILEYPVILVFLPTHNYEFEVEKDTRPVPKKVEPPTSVNGNMSPKGNLFVEEEIEEGEMYTDTLVTDLTRNSSTSTITGSKPFCPFTEKTGHVLDMQMSREPTNGLKSNFGHKCQYPMVNEAKRNCVEARIPQKYDMQLSGTVSVGSEPCCSQNYPAYLMEKAEIFSGSPVDSWNPPVEARIDFQQELREAYADLMGEMNPDDFLCLDGGYSELDNLEELLKGDELEEGEIPSQ